MFIAALKASFIIELKFKPELDDMKQLAKNFEKLKEEYKL
jgi:hypothetical protein